MIFFFFFERGMVDHSRLPFIFHKGLVNVNIIITKFSFGSFWAADH